MYKDTDMLIIAPALDVQRLYHANYSTSARYIKTQIC